MTDKTKNMFKKITSAFFSVALVGTLATNAFAANARFNFLPGDNELFTGRNTSKGETTWTDPVSADPGNEVEGLVYYHNGIENSTATNVKVKVTLPNANTFATQHVLAAQISADNADTITDTVVNGQVVGKSGLTINASSSASVSFVPGSVKWYPDGSQAAINLPANQSGDELVTSGVNLGNIQGCWSHAGYVTFKVKLNAPKVEAPQPKIVKEVAVSTDANNWQKKVTVAPNADVKFKLTLTNTGKGKIDNAHVIDALPNGLTFVPNSVLLYVNDGTTPRQLAGDITKGIDLGILWPTTETGDVTTKLTVVFTAHVASTFEDCTIDLVNTATVKAGDLSATDTAAIKVVVTGGKCEGQPRIEKSKSAFNETQGKDATTQAAKPGDVIKYTLTTKNTGNAKQSAFVVEDGIRDILDYADVTAISDNGVTVDQPQVSERDNQVIVRYPAVDIAAGQSIIRTFTVKIKNPVPTTAQNGNAYDFKMFNVYGNNVLVPVERPQVVSISIVKDVRNVSKNEGVFIDHNQASPGDVLEYQVKTKNIGNKSVNALLKDVLPNGVTFVSNSITLKRGTETIAVKGDLFGDGIELNDFGQNIEFTLVFKVNTSDKLADSTNLVNKAIVKYGSEQKEDTASTVIIAPVKPTENPPETQAPKPTESNLPSAGANPFGLIVPMAGAAYTWMTKRKMKKQLDNLSAFVEIV